MITKQRIIRHTVNIINGATAIFLVNYINKPIEKLVAIIILFIISMINFYDGFQSKP